MKETNADGSTIEHTVDHEQDDPREKDPKRRTALPQEVHQEKKLEDDPQAKEVDRDRHHLQDRNEHHPKQGKARQANLADQYVSAT